MLKSLYETFLQERRFLKNCSPKTLRSYGQAWSAFESALAPVTDVADVRAGVKAGVLAMMSDGKRKPSSINVYLRAINAFLRWGSLGEHFKPPIKSVTLLKTPTMVPKPMPFRATWTGPSSFWTGRTACTIRGSAKSRQTPCCAASGTTRVTLRRSEKWNCRSEPPPHAVGRRCARLQERPAASIHWSRTRSPAMPSVVLLIMPSLPIRTSLGTPRT